jgi:hypothetical protein
MSEEEAEANLTNIKKFLDKDIEKMEKIKNKTKKQLEDLTDELGLGGGTDPATVNKTAVEAAKAAAEIAEEAKILAETMKKQIENREEILGGARRKTRKHKKKRTRKTRHRKHVKRQQN